VRDAEVLLPLEEHLEESEGSRKPAEHETWISALFNSKMQGIKK
jgi:hypothetical protein